MIIGLVDKRERKKYKTRTRVPEIEQPYGTNTGQIRQMAPGRCMGVMGTGFQILASKGSGAAEDIDSSAYSAQVSVLNLGRRGKKPEFSVKGRRSQTKAHWNSREEQPLISDRGVCLGRSGYTTVVTPDPTAGKDSAGSNLLPSWPRSRPNVQGGRPAGWLY